MVGSVGNAVMDKVIDAFEPLILLAQALSYPLTYLAIATGICLIIVGQKRRGMVFIKWASVGYILMQWLPSIMKILHDVGGAMTQ